MTNDNERVCKSECSNFKENGHGDMYLNWRHQGDGFNYYYCPTCGWIKPDMKSPIFLSEISKAEKRGYDKAVNDNVWSLEIKETSEKEE